MKNLLLAFLLISSTSFFGQIKGTVTQSNGAPLPFVNILLENTYVATSSNAEGVYELPITTTGKYTLVFQYLGYKSKKVAVSVTSLPHTLNVSMQEEQFDLSEVVINPASNPAIEIVKNAIAFRKENSEKTQRFTADFYSRGMFKVKNVPKKILGQKLDVFDEVLDSTRSGILYLSETISKIKFQKPADMTETIIASKVSGDDRGFSFNSAASANFDFYENTIAFGIPAISPIANNAFNYYKYKYGGSFFDENNKQVHKIEVIARRDEEPTMQGFIYIVDNSWALYGIDLSARGSQIQIAALDEIHIVQNFNYNATNKLWVKNAQTLDFMAGIFKIKFSGRFTYVYSNFEFPNAFEKKTFTKEVVNFADNANKKDNVFWDSIRPVPLTAEEANDYVVKEELQTKRESKTYLDSVDRVGNKFKIFDVVTGYSHRNSFKNNTYKYDGFLLGLGFNTVQGYNISTGVSFTHKNPEEFTSTTFGAKMNYGFAENRFRTNGYVRRIFNNTTKRAITVSGGNSIEQFNPDKPISRILNSIATSFFKNNYMKLYDKTFGKIEYSEEVVNGIKLDVNAEYSRRQQLFNNSENSIIRNENGFTSNNPLNPTDFTTPFFETHQLAVAEIGATFRFGQQYWSRPDGKFNIINDNLPILYVGYKKGFAGSEKKYEFDYAQASVTYDLKMGNKGLLGMHLKAGKFFGADGISFVDYKHFNGNQTHVAQADRYLNVYNLLPYYASSTNDSFLELHTEYSDNGFIINKIPLLNKLEAPLVLGFHSLAIPNQKPYLEYSIGLDKLGFGKFKMFRLDYVRSYQNGNSVDGLIFGIKILNILE
ncbi:MAG: DUF5686 and carboxypeptidase regulatory-like domain-containing protein [Flavobacterium sp.]